MKNYGIRDGYTPNLKNKYYNDAPDDGIIWQPDVYEYAVAYARKHKIPYIIDIGSGNGEKLEKYKNDFSIVFIDFGANLDIIRSKFKGSSKKHKYVDQDFEKSFPDLDKKIVENSVVICSDVIEHIRNMDKLGGALVEYSKTAKLLMISTPDRERLYGYDQDGIPLNPCHVREWRLEELKSYFAGLGMQFHIGLTRTNDRANQRATLFIISGQDFAKSPVYAEALITPKAGYLTKVVLSENLTTYLKGEGLRTPKAAESALGLLNLLDGDFMLNHYIRALQGGYSYTINHFKFVNKDAQNKFYNSGVENLDRLLVQYAKTTRHGKSDAKPYPISFSFVHDASYLTAGDKQLMTLPVEQLTCQYLPEFILGFENTSADKETLTLMPNQANVERDQNATNNLIQELQVKLADVEAELHRVYSNPAYYAVHGGKKLARKVTRK